MTNQTKSWLSVFIAVLLFVGFLQPLVMAQNILTDPAAPNSGDLISDPTHGNNVMQGSGTPGITVTPQNLTTSEDGTQASFFVFLNTKPLFPVNIDITIIDPSEGSLDKTFLVFNEVDFGIPQQVTVTGEDDAATDGNVTYQLELSPVSADPTYNSLPSKTVTITNIDNDFSDVVVSTTSLSTSELLTSDNFTVVLKVPPTDNVLITFSGVDASEGTLSDATLTFTTSNWNVPQTVTVTGVDDADVDGPQTYNIFTVASSSDSSYDGVQGTPITVTNEDDETASVVVSPTNLTTSEDGTTATFEVQLTVAPTSNVDILLSNTDALEGTLSVNSLNFTSGNWMTPQSVTVTGEDDNVLDGAVTYAIETQMATSDAAYASIDPADVFVTNLDNEQPEVTVSPTDLTTDEASGSAFFEIVLGAQPSVDVTITLTGVDASEGLIDKSVLIFTPANYNVPQVVNVFGVNDNEADGDQTYTIVTTLTTTDTVYSGVDPSDVTVTNLDDETAQIIVNPTALNVAEDKPGQNSFTVRLATTPLVGETVTATISFNTAQLTVSPTTLFFTAANYATPQTVSVDAIADGVDESPTTYGITVALSSDMASSPLDGLSQSVSVTIYDTASSIVVGLPYPKNGMIKIDIYHTQPAFVSPSEGFIRTSQGEQIYLPADFDGNGFDTYVVTDIRTYLGQRWLGLWVGELDVWAWIPYNEAMIEIVDPLNLIIETEWTLPSHQVGSQ